MDHEGIGLPPRLPSVSDHIADIENEIRFIFKMILEKRYFRINYLEEKTGISSDKLYKISGAEPPKRNRSNRSATPRKRADASLTLQQLQQLLLFCEAEGFGNDNEEVAPVINESYDKITSAFSPNVTATQLGLPHPINFTALIDNSMPSVADLELISGVYLTFRRLPFSRKILVSALSVEYDHDLDIVRWENFHPVERGVIPYSGAVLSQDNHFLFIGQREDDRYINLFSMRRPVKQRNEIHGVGLVESDDRPTVCRVFLLRQHGISDLKELKDFCGNHSEEYCTDRLRLPSIDYVNLVKNADSNSLDFFKSIVPYT